MKPLVSVIIPTYNRGYIVSRAIRSVLNQTHRNIECIIVDDGSTDNTPELIRGLSDSRIHYIQHTKNQGLSVARNIGIKRSKGEFIAFLDSDDEFLPEKLEFQIEAFEKNRNLNLGLMYTGGYFITHKKRGTYFQNLTSSGIVYGAEQREKNIFPTRIMFPPPSLWVFPKNVALTVGFFDENMRSYNDTDYFVRIALSYDIYFLNIPLALRYQLSSDYLSAPSVQLMKEKEWFFDTYKNEIAKDKDFMFGFMKRLGRNWAVLGKKSFAIKYFFRAFKVKPYKIELIGQMMKVFLTR